MQREDVHVGQRIRINMPGVGDHGQAGTVKKVRGGACSIHLDWDHRLHHVVVFFPADLDLITHEPQLEPSSVTPEGAI